MKKAIWAILLFGASAYGQVSNPSIVSVSSAPSGACTLGLPNQQVISTGTQYSCQAGTWGAIAGGGGGTGTVTTVSVTTANGVSGTVATATTTPAISLTLGAITPTSTNGVTAATMAFVDPTSSIQTQLNARATGTISSCGTAAVFAFYSTTGTTVSCNTLLGDNGTTLTYNGTGGMNAAKYTSTGAPGLTFAAAASAPGVAGSVVYTVDASTGLCEINENNTGNSHCLTALNTTGHTLSGPLLCADTSASGTAQVCTTSPSFTPVTGDFVIYTTTTANTGTGLTLNVNSLGAKSVAKWQGTTTLAANDVLANKKVLATYDGTNWELSTIGNAPGGSSAVAGAFSTYGYGGGSFLQIDAANHTDCVGIAIPISFTSTKIAFAVTVADGTNNTDFGIYNSAGTLISHIGAQHLASTGGQTVAWTGGTATIPAGKDYFCMTGAANTFELAGWSNPGTFYTFANVTSTTTGGALNSTITPPADVVTQGASASFPFFILE